ncbi:hypothetical protein [Streptomyces aidingensis]|uniref:Uncharacterized protein n=1 Tax=Streptomyces aidingensis TaxID=910347 RepID=A0A1I1DYM5_9ACTN|nr:hypothetical protein [Streptomyces aidingensis]SFB80011.1 hypothetical protein SAMN05421773_10138 [Streptomyces aidingensis]
MSYGDDFGDTGARTVPSQTRTRLPDEPGPSSRRAPASPGRSLFTIIGVFVVLIGAIVFANLSDGDGGPDEGTARDSAGGPATQPTAPTGEAPVDTAVNGIPTGHPQSEQGAQSAAANYAVALGGDGMFTTDSRHAIVGTVYDAAVVPALVDELDRAYSEEALALLGLDAEGNPPAGMTFVSRTLPVGTSLVAYTGTSATVDVWYTGLIGMAGESARNPVRTTWKTWTFELVWSDGDWKIVEDSQADGPAPVPGDNRASTAEEIAEAVEEFGGFTYAR